MIISASFVCLCFPKKAPEPSDWCVVRYRSEDGKVFTATGTGLPTTSAATVKLDGEWKNSSKYGDTFVVKSYELELPSSKSGAVAYLVSLSVGIGRRRAERLYAAFGEKLWDVIENEPEKLRAVRGVPAKSVSRLIDKLADTKEDRALVRELSGFIELSTNQLSEVKRRFGAKAAETVRTHPYRLAEVGGVSFRSLERLGEAKGIPAIDKERMYCVFQYTLEVYSKAGHTCCPTAEFVQLAKKLASRPKEQVRDKEIVELLKDALKEKVLARSNGMIYTRRSYLEETYISGKLAQMASTPVKAVQERGLDNLIGDYEASSGITLAQSQREGVKNVFRHRATVITGGPGTGKSTVVKCILELNKAIFGGSSEPVLLSPTGRAAKRLTEVTGHQAMTIHRAVEYRGDEEGYIVSPSAMKAVTLDPIDGDLFIVDEASMADQHICTVLLSRLPEDARIVFIGDPDQLPSVGAGNVLADVIASGAIPCTRLDVIFRQDEQSSVIANAQKILAGETSLVRDAHFHMLEMGTAAEVYRKAISLYVGAVKRYGADNVLLLNPTRGKTDISCDRLNKNIQHLINPFTDESVDPTITAAGSVYHAGDRVMQMRNTEACSNGDVGVVKRVSFDENGDKVAVVDFDGRELVYDREEMKDLCLAYATTVHKAQGTEVDNVILILSKEHEIMLRRNLLYTAITRAKVNVAIVSEDESPVTLAILNDRAGIRNTLLAQRLKAANAPAGK